MKVIGLMATALALAGVGLHLDESKATPIDPKGAGIGKTIPDFAFKDLRGQSSTLSQVAGTKATVIALTGVSCPLSKKFGPTLAKMEDDFRAKGVNFIYVNPAEAETADEARKDAKRLGLDGPYVKGDALVATLGAKTTTEVFVLDGARRLVYRGAVDDQYGLNYSLEKPKSTYLKDALNAFLKGESPKTAATSAPGCVLASSVPSPSAATYYKHIAAMVQENCVDCHRKGGVAPFSLETYEDVKSRAPMLKFAVEKGIMPPWFAVQKGPSPWKNDRSLSDSDKQVFFDWIDAGMPKGDPSDAPEAKTFESGWAIGKPDMIVEIPSPVKVQATGFMPYQIATVKTTLTEDRWIEAMEIQPTSRGVVHHVLIFVKQKGSTGGLQDIGEELSGFFAAYVPGNDHMIYPDGFGKKLPAGASLKFQIHYTPNGTEAVDQTKLGLVFAKKPIQHEVRTFGIANIGIRIPAGAEHHKETAQIPVPYDVKLLSFIPHMHVRGSAARYDLLKADGTRETLLDIPKYDFNWQLTYEYAKPLDIPKGSKVEFAGWFNNSDKNPANPDPTKTVRWGAQTYDEMHLGYVEYYVPGAKPGEGPGALRASPALAVIEGIFKSLDRDKDGFVTAEEAGRAWERVKEADANGDGKLTMEEVLARFGG